MINLIIPKRELKMKTMTIICTLMCTGLLFSSCKKEDDKVIETKGFIEFRTSNPMTSSNKSTLLLKSFLTNPPLTGDTTVTHSTSFKLCVGDVWVSQGVVKAGEADNLEWVRLTSTTNTEATLFENYSFSAVEIPAGDYKSIKIIFRNVFYRYAQLVSDTSVKYELLETMGSWISPCDEADTTWATINYFGPDGNHNLNDNDLFELVVPGEKIGGFNIKAAKTAIVTWRLFAGATTPCITYLIDANNNLEWDCGIDHMEFECPPEVEYMWDFVVQYE